MPGEFAFALQPILLLGCSEPGKMPADQEAEVSKDMTDEKEVHCVSLRHLGHFL